MSTKLTQMEFARRYANELIGFLEDYGFDGHKHWTPFDYEQGASADGPPLTRKKLLKLFEKQLLQKIKTV